MTIYREDELEKAEQYVLGTQNLMKNKYCPVFKKKCLGFDCVSFYQGTTAKNLLKQITVYPADCNSPFVTGVINYQE